MTSKPSTQSPVRPSIAPTKATVGDSVVAIHDFKRRTIDELEFSKGDIIFVVEDDVEFGDGWFLGRNRATGHAGLYPEVYTRRLPQPNAAPAMTGESSTSGGALPDDDGNIFPYTRAQVQSWTPHDVAAYLLAAGTENCYCEEFKDQEISGEVLLGMDQSTLFLKQLNLGSIGKRLKLWLKIKTLQERLTGETPSESQVGDKKRRQDGADDTGRPRDDTSSKGTQVWTLEGQPESTPDTGEFETPSERQPRVQVNLDSEPQLPKRSRKLYGNSRSSRFLFAGHQPIEEQKDQPNEVVSPPTGNNRSHNNGHSPVGDGKVDDATQTGVIESSPESGVSESHAYEDEDSEGSIASENSDQNDGDERSHEIGEVDMEEETLTEVQDSEGEDETVESPQSSTFDHDLRSKGTKLSTVPTSHRGMKERTLPEVSAIPETGELAAVDRFETRDTDTHSLQAPDGLIEDETEGQQPASDDCDVDTTYSISDELCIENIATEYLDPVLKEFAWKLHGESSNPFQWEASVIIHRKRKNIIEVLIPRPLDHDDMGTQDVESSLSESADGNELPNRVPFRKPRAMVMQWVGDVKSSPLAAEETGHPIDGSVRDGLEYDNVKEPQPPLPGNIEILSQLPDYEEFIRESDAYQWLLTKIRQHGLLTFEGPNAMLEIGTKIRNQLRAHEPLRKMSSRKPPSLVKMTFNIDWNPVRFMNEAGFPHPLEETLPGVLCLTGSWNEAQAATSPSLCSISVTGGLYFVSEMGEQIAWLASALRSSPVLQGPVACIPRVKDLQLNKQDERPQELMIAGSCSLSFNFERVETSTSMPGFCWGNLFYNPVLVHSYPILRRSQPDSGLEMSLANMATIIGSQQVVQWDERVIMKGFNILLVATLAATDIIVWHVLVGEKSDDRISYVDPRLDALYGDISQDFTLRNLETKRHVIGWCSKVTDLCGLRKPPASIVIDRLYLEAGADFVAGLNMSFNKKEKPFWLERENDYPSLLKWVSVQPIIFYDVVERRGWIADGASALLHLVRISLYMDENDPESTFDWVFDTAKFRDEWNGVTGRQAAIKTLKSWDNLDLNVYVIGRHRRSDGESETKYATLEKRVKKILHSIEILIDRQVMIASQDGIKISQTLDLRRDIVGFDILDVLNPLGPIHPRIKRLDSWGHGWVDLIPSIGITTIFGRGFGDLIRPDEPETICNNWKSVPEKQDYLVASVSTLQMLYEKRLLRIEPGLGKSEMTSKIVWTSPNHPFKACECLQSGSSNIGDGGCHVDPVQFLVAKRSWKPRLVLRGSTPIDITTLDEKGAVVFGHVPFLSRKSEGKSAFEQQDEDLDTSTSSVELSSQGILQPPLVSSAASESTRSVGLTGTTVPSSGASRSSEAQEENISRSDAIKVDNKKSEKWRVLKKWTRR
ncbi:hypothetical protein G7Z17_g11861 [Cylindrodendrum hubeiense]|uniref:SH3 domain-containing protein n=1 Tax=Cylindrodendrum hubeiense TaxID=595255 RepID=A0A9P5H209_9HYPO|nr:hypothetical protein G7Z17_g11861 [Cylindrodendrum hubeiense]